MFEAKIEIDEKSLKRFIIEKINEVYSNQDARRPSECVPLTSDDSGLALGRKSSLNSNNANQLIRQMTTKDGLKKMVFRNSTPIRAIGFILTYIFCTLYTLFMTPTYVILVGLLIVFAIPVVLITCCFDRISRIFNDFDGWFKFFKQIAHGQPRFSFLLLWLVSNICNALAFSFFIRHINFRSEIQSWEVGYWTYQFIVASLYVSVFRESYSKTENTYRGFEFEKMVAAWAGRFQVAVNYRDLEIGVVRKARDALKHMTRFKLEEELEDTHVMKEVKKISQKDKNHINDDDFLYYSKQVNLAMDEVFQKIASTDENSKTMYGTIAFFLVTSLERMRPHSIAVMFAVCMLPAVYIAIVCNWFFVDRHTLECESSCQVIQECCKVVQGNYDVTFIVANMVGNVIAVFVGGKIIVYAIIASHLGPIPLPEIQDLENQQMEKPPKIESKPCEPRDPEQVTSQKLTPEETSIQKNGRSSKLPDNRLKQDSIFKDNKMPGKKHQPTSTNLTIMEQSAHFDDGDSETTDGSSLTGLSVQEIRIEKTKLSEFRQHINLSSPNNV